jgi:hypothetical protein
MVDADNDDVHHVAAPLQSIFTIICSSLLGTQVP